jgi:hypothetical protein
MRPLSIPLILLLSLSLSCSQSNSVNSNNINTPGTTSDATNKKPNEDDTVVFTIPMGPSGVVYENVDVEEVEPWGPSAFTIGPDGTYFSADAVNNKILRFRPNGNQMPSISVEGVVGVTDITVSNDSIHVPDQAAITPIIRLTMDGKMQEKTLLSPEVIEEDYFPTFNRWQIM